jgi:fatty-acyl-CoA synthase
MHLVEMEIGYGMTETSPLSTQTRHDAPFDKRVSTVEFYHIQKKKSFIQVQIKLFP